GGCGRPGAPAASPGGRGASGAGPGPGRPSLPAPPHGRGRAWSTGRREWWSRSGGPPPRGCSWQQYLQHDVGGGGGEEDRVDPIQHSPVAGQQVPHVLDPEIALEQGLREVAAGGDEHQHRTDQGAGPPGQVQREGADGGDPGGAQQQGAGEPLPALLRADPRRHRVLAEQHPRDIAADVVADRPRHGIHAAAHTPPATSRGALSPRESVTRQRIRTQTAAAVATSSPSAPKRTVETTIPISPTSSGTCGSRRPPCLRARVTAST